MDPHLALGIGPSLHDDDGYTANGDLVGDVLLSAQPLPERKWFRLGVHHISDPATFSDAGTTWGKAFIVFGAN